MHGRHGDAALTKVEPNSAQDHRQMIPSDNCGINPQPYTYTQVHLHSFSDENWSWKKV